MALDPALAELNPIRYRGYYYDVETGYYFLKTRYYNPEWRRFINADSAFLAGDDVLNGTNMYAYCNGNPVMYTDPTGMGILTKFFDWFDANVVPVMNKISDFMDGVAQVLHQIDNFARAMSPLARIVNDISTVVVEVSNACLTGLGQLSDMFLGGANNLMGSENPVLNALGIGLMAIGLVTAGAAIASGCVLVGSGIMAWSSGIYLDIFGDGREKASDRLDDLVVTPPVVPPPVTPPEVGHDVLELVEFYGDAEMGEEEESSRSGGQENQNRSSGQGQQQTRSVSFNKNLLQMTVFENGSFAVMARSDAISISTPHSWDWYSAHVRINEFTLPLPPMQEQHPWSAKIINAGSERVGSLCADLVVNGRRIDGGILYIAVMKPSPLNYALVPKGVQAKAGFFPGAIKHTFTAVSPVTVSVIGEVDGWLYVNTGLEAPKQRMFVEKAALTYDQLLCVTASGTQTVLHADVNGGAAFTIFNVRVLSRVYFSWKVTTNSVQVHFVDSFVTARQPPSSFTNSCRTGLDNKGTKIEGNEYPRTTLQQRTGVYDDPILHNVRSVVNKSFNMPIDCITHGFVWNTEYPFTPSFSLSFTVT